jgi:uncharacterized protein YdcH (DUF465 family)
MVRNGAKAEIKQVLKVHRRPCLEVGDKILKNIKFNMKNKSYILMVAVIAIAAAGCDKSNVATDNSTAGDTNQPTLLQSAASTATNAWQQTKDATSDAWYDLKDSLSSATNYTYEQKDEFVAAATNDLAILDQKIQALSDKATSASDSVKADAQTKIQELRAKRAALDQKLTDVQNSTDANWNDVKAGFQSSYDDAKSSVKSAWQWLKDKMSQ